jgi:hypothetical protein
MIFLWLFSVLFTIWKIELTDAVAIALITTTTINVLGLLYVVVNYLFPTPSPGKPFEPSGK